MKNTADGQQKIAITPFLPSQDDPGLPVHEVTATATFTRPDGTAAEARVTLFQIDGSGVIGVGVYPGPGDAGTVLRWDKGLGSAPSVVHWRAPHCADDQCGSPCGHRRGGAFGFLKRGRRQ